LGNSNNKSKKIIKKDKRSFSYNKDVAGIVISTIGLISLLSLFNQKMGIVGQIISGTTFTLMGFGGYFFPFIFISIGIILIFDKFKQREVKVSIALFLLFLCFLILLDRINTVDQNLLLRIKNAMALSKFGKGGGIFGSFFGYFFYNLFGTVGSYIVILMVMVINLLLITNTKIQDIIKKVNTNEISKTNEVRINNIDNKEVKKDQNYIESNVNEKTTDLTINDYNVKSKEIAKNVIDINTKGPESIDIDTEVKQNIKSHQTKYQVPSIKLLKNPEFKNNINDKKEILNNAKIIENTMRNFGIEASISNINKGPTITCYELMPAPDVKLSRIVSLSDNISMNLASSDIRIEAPIPGKTAVGIEVPNKVKDVVLLRDIVTTEEFQSIDSDIPMALGKNVAGKPIVTSIDKMPHLLIAGATGSGKSVCINSIIMSILFTSSPEKVKLLLIDPKVVELSVYNGIPHLLIPVVTDAKKASFALNWAVTEMEKRYKIFAQNNVRDIVSYNSKMKDEIDKLSKIVIIIDELADLMMVAAQEIEDYICRLAQMARAAGMYLIVATQRPSVDVITGTIKANIPSRISFAVSSQIDSRTILDMSGAEKLLGKGDMLFYPSFYSKPVRLQGVYVDDSDVENVVNFLKDQHIVEYDEEIIDIIQNTKDIDMKNSDELLPDAIKLVVDEGQASISFLQRKLKVGYARAARIVDEMEERGIIGGYEGSKPRKVLINKEDLED